MKSFKTLYFDFYDRFRIHLMRKRTKAKYKADSNRYVLSSAQKKEIKAYFKELSGQDVSLNWHEYLSSRRKEYHKEYIPSDFFRFFICPRANRLNYGYAYSDKNMNDIYLHGVRHPEKVLKNMNGFFYRDNEAISREEAVKLIQNIDNVLIKPTLLTHGDGIRKLTVVNGITNLGGITVEELFDRYKEDYLIEGFVHQHPDMAKLNPSSVNTIRALTYRSGMDVIPLYTVIRIGRKGQPIDNESAGGISAVINPDGTLGKYGYGSTSYEPVEKTDTGVTLEGYKIPSYDKVIDTIKRLHLQLPFFRIVGWDICVDEEGEPVLIEWNSHAELSQSANGPAFGENTERLIREVSEMVPFTVKIQNATVDI